MKLMYKLTMLMLLAVMLVAFNIPASAETASTASAVTTSTCPYCTTWSKTLPSTSTLSSLISPSYGNYKLKDKLLYEMTKTKNNVNNYLTTTFGAGTMQALSGAGASKTMSRYNNGTWHIVISVGIPAGYRAVVTDYLYNLLPIQSSFNPRPEYNVGNYIEWHIPATTFTRTVTLVFNARQVSPGFVGDQGYVYYYLGSRMWPADIVPSNQVFAPGYI